MKENANYEEKWFLGYWYASLLVIIFPARNSDVSVPSSKMYLPSLVFALLRLHSVMLLVIG